MHSRDLPPLESTFYLDNSERSSKRLGPSCVLDVLTDANAERNGLGKVSRKFTKVLTKYQLQSSSHHNLISNNAKEGPNSNNNTLRPFWLENWHEMLTGNRPYFLASKNFLTQVRFLRWNGSGTKLAAAGNDGTVKLFSIRSQQAHSCGLQQEKEWTEHRYDTSSTIDARYWYGTGITDLVWQRHRDIFATAGGVDRSFTIYDVRNMRTRNSNQRRRSDGRNASASTSSGGAGCTARRVRITGHCLSFDFKPNNDYYALFTDHYDDLTLIDMRMLSGSSTTISNTPASTRHTHRRGTTASITTSGGQSTTATITSDRSISLSSSGTGSRTQQQQPSCVVNKVSLTPYRNLSNRLSFGTSSPKMSSTPYSYKHMPGLGQVRWDPYAINSNRAVLCLDNDIIVASLGPDGLGLLTTSNSDPHSGGLDTSAEDDLESYQGSNEVKDQGSKDRSFRSRAENNVDNDNNNNNNNKDESNDHDNTSSMLESYLETTAARNKPKFNRLSAHTGRTKCIRFDHVGRYFAVGGADGKVSVWDRNELYCAHSMEALDGSIESLSFSPPTTKKSSEQSPGSVLTCVGRDCNYVEMIQVGTKNVTKGYESLVKRTSAFDNGYFGGEFGMSTGKKLRFGMPPGQYENAGEPSQSKKFLCQVAEWHPKLFALACAYDTFQLVTNIVHDRRRRGRGPMDEESGTFEHHERKDEGFLAMLVPR
eukprot:g3881.t1